MAAGSSPKLILHHLEFAGWSWGRCGSHKDPCQTKFQFHQVLCMGGIKLQLLCGVRIKMTIRSFPYPGNYIDFQFVSLRRDRPLAGYPMCKPCLDMRQNPIFLLMEGVHPKTKTKRCTIIIISFILLSTKVRSS